MAILQNGKLARASEKLRHVMISIKQKAKKTTIKITKCDGCDDAMRCDGMDSSDKIMKNKGRMRATSTDRD